MSAFSEMFEDFGGKDEKYGPKVNIGNNWVRPNQIAKFPVRKFRKFGAGEARRAIVFAKMKDEAGLLISMVVKEYGGKKYFFVNYSLREAVA